MSGNYPNWNNENDIPAAYRSNGFVGGFGNMGMAATSSKMFYREPDRIFRGAHEHFSRRDEYRQRKFEMDARYNRQNGSHFGSRSGNSLSLSYRNRYGDHSPEGYLNLRISQFDRGHSNAAVRAILLKELACMAPFEVKVINEPHHRDLVAYINFVDASSAKKVRKYMVPQLREALGKFTMFDPAKVVTGHTRKGVSNRFYRPAAANVERERSPGSCSPESYERLLRNRSRSNSKDRRARHQESSRMNNRSDENPSYHYNLNRDDKQATRSLYLGNLPYMVRRRELKQLFAQYGPMEDLDIKLLPRYLAAYAFVRFYAVEDAIRALHEQHNKPVRPGSSEKFQIGYAKNSVTRRLYVGGLEPWITEDMLMGEFDRYGVIQKIEYEEGNSFAYVFFEDSNCAVDACARMKNFDFGNGRGITVDFANGSLKEEKSRKKRADSEDESRHGKRARGPRTPSGSPPRSQVESQTARIPDESPPRVQAKCRGPRTPSGSPPRSEVEKRSPRTPSGSPPRIQAEDDPGSFTDLEDIDMDLEDITAPETPPLFPAKCVLDKSPENDKKACTKTADNKVREVRFAIDQENGEVKTRKSESRLKSELASKNQTDAICKRKEVEISKHRKEHSSGTKFISETSKDDKKASDLKAVTKKRKGVHFTITDQEQENLEQENKQCHEPQPKSAVLVTTKEDQKAPIDKLKDKYPATLKQDARQRSKSRGKSLAVNFVKDDRNVVVSQCRDKYIVHLDEVNERTPSITIHRESEVSPNSVSRPKRGKSLAVRFVKEESKPATTECKEKQTSSFSNENNRKPWRARGQSVAVKFAPEEEKHGKSRKRRHSDSGMGSDDDSGDGKRGRESGTPPRSPHRSLRKNDLHTLSQPIDETVDINKRKDQLMTRLRTQKNLSKAMEDEAWKTRILGLSHKSNPSANTVMNVVNQNRETTTKQDDSNSECSKDEKRDHAPEIPPVSPPGSYDSDDHKEMKQHVCPDMPSISPPRRDSDSDVSREATQSPAPKALSMTPEKSPFEPNCLTEDQYIHTIFELGKQHSWTWKGKVKLKEDGYLFRFHRVFGKEDILQEILRDEDGNPLELGITQRLPLDQGLYDKLRNKALSQTSHKIFTGKKRYWCNPENESSDQTSSSTMDAKSSETSGIKLSSILAPTPPASTFLKPPAPKTPEVKISIEDKDISDLLSAVDKLLESTDRPSTSTSENVAISETLQMNGDADQSEGLEI
ncbi:RNA recognition motif domain-containing protein [Ditylenchus destructor]|nr:RNA recognition motif domain-containing protein [Ditylenchus destructor]